MTDKNKNEVSHTDHVDIVEVLALGCLLIVMIVLSFNVLGDMGDHSYQTDLATQNSPDTPETIPTELLLVSDGLEFKVIEGDIPNLYADHIVHVNRSPSGWFIEVFNGEDRIYVGPIHSYQPHWTSTNGILFLVEEPNFVTSLYYYNVMSGLEFRLAALDNDAHLNSIEVIKEDGSAQIRLIIGLGQNYVFRSEKDLIEHFIGQ